MNMSQPLRTLSFCALFLSLFLALLRLQPTATVNSASRLATIESLADHKTFYIDQSSFRDTFDKARLPNGHFISEKPPLQALLGSLVYRALKPLGLPSLTPEARLTIRTLTFFLAWISLALLIAGFAKALQALSLSRETVLQTTALFSITCLSCGYGASINNHIAAAACIIFSWAFYLKERLLLAGIIGALAVFFDLPSVLYCGLLALLVAKNHPKQTTFKFLVVSLLMGASFFILNFIATDYWLPLYFYPEWIFYAGSWWDHPAAVDALHYGPLKQLFHMFLGHHGILSHSPLLLIAIPGLILQKRLRPILGLFGALTLFYVLAAPNKFGGEAVGFRFFVHILPLLYLGLPEGWDWLTGLIGKKRAAWITLPLVVISIYFWYYALVNPWRLSPWGRLWFPAP